MLSWTSWQGNISSVFASLTQLNSLRAWQNSLIFSISLNTKVQRSWTMLLLVWLWPSSRFPLPTQLNTLWKNAEHCLDYALREKNSEYLLNPHIIFELCSKITTDWWLQCFRQKICRQKIRCYRILASSRESRIYPRCGAWCEINLWNIIKSCTEFANLRGATSPQVLAVHRSREQHRSILWWASLFRADWQEPEQSSICLRSKFEQGFDFHMESISKSWGVERNWMIPLSEPAKWLKAEMKRILWRLSDLEREKYAPKSNKNSAETVFCSLSSTSALQNSDAAFWNPLNFRGLRAQQNQAKRDHKIFLEGGQVLSESI